MKVMNKMRKGATFIEYAMLAGLVAIVVAGAAFVFGDELKELFTQTKDKTTSAKQIVQKVEFKKQADNGQGADTQRNKGKPE